MAPQGYSQACSPTILYTVQLCTCTKAYLQSSLMFPFKWENVPIIPIILTKIESLLCLKLCWHYLPGPTMLVCIHVPFATQVTKGMVIITVALLQWNVGISEQGGKCGTPSLHVLNVVHAEFVSIHSKLLSCCWCCKGLFQYTPLHCILQGRMYSHQSRGVNIPDTSLATYVVVSHIEILHV